MMTQRSLLKWFVVPCSLVIVVACGKEAQVTPPESPAKATPQKAAVAKVATGTVEGTTSTEMPPPRYTYVTESRRDPFQPFLMIRRPINPDADLSAQTPLQQYDTTQYKLSAVIVGYGQPMVMVIAPNGKSYVVRKGMKIGRSGGTVIQINKEGFLVEEKYRDLTDEVRTNMLEIKLPKREGV